MKKYRKKRGHTLAAVIVFLLLVTILWSGSLSQQGSYFRIEKACLMQKAGRDGCIHSLAWALTLLETGLPPKSPYSCRMVSPVDANEVFVATFTQVAGINYDINIRLAGQGDESLPQAPETFEQIESQPRLERLGRPGGGRREGFRQPGQRRGSEQSGRSEWSGRARKSRK